MIDSVKFEQVCRIFHQIVNQYGKLEKEIHKYKTDTPLYLADTHTIADIGKNENMNIARLSRLQGISRSAVSQMVSKLVKRGFVKKESSPVTDNEIVLTLTEEGKKVFETHEKQHQWLQEKLTAVFEKYPEDTLDLLINLGGDIQKMWEELKHIEL